MLYSDPTRYYMVIADSPCASANPQKPNGTLNVLGYIRVAPEEKPTTIARVLYPTFLFRLEACDFPEAVVQQGNVGFVGGGV